MSDAQFIGRYRLIDLLGRGGFAAVYRAENTSLGIEVALKIMDQSLAQDEQFVNRFRQEARETARLDHPNIVRVLDLNQIDGQLFIAMEYVPGQDLSRWLGEREQLLPLDQVTSIVNQVAAALDYAHQHKLVHRDVKPHNILIRPDGGVKLVDFGIVKAAEGSQLTKTGTLIGTPTYMSPEQIQGSAVGPGSDIYSLGIVTYELVTGRIPFTGDTASLGYKHVHEPPPLPSAITPRAGGPVETVLLRALEKSPDDRYETAGAFAVALAEAVKIWESETISEQYQLSRRLLAERQYAAALSELEALQSLAPNYQDVEALLAQATAGLELEQLYRKAGDHLQNARELAARVHAKDPEFPDHQFVFQTLQGSPGLNEAATVVERQPTGLQEVKKSAPPQLTSRSRSIIIALRWAGLATALFSFNGFWRLAEGDAWGLNALTAEFLLPYPFIAPIIVLIYIGLLILQRFLPRLTLLWRVLRVFLAICGVLILLYATISVFDNRSTGTILAVSGLLMAGLADILDQVLE